MTEIKLERKPGLSPAWLWALAAAAIITLIAIWWSSDDDELEDADRVTTVAPGEPDRDRAEVPPPAPLPAVPRAPAMAEESGDAVPVNAILDAPEQWKGRTVSGVARVGSVPTDRGFWIEHEGRGLFVVIDPRGEETPYTVKPGTRIRITRATVRAAADRDALGGDVWRETRSILENQQVYLQVEGRDLELLQA